MDKDHCPLLHTLVSARCFLTSNTPVHAKRQPGGCAPRPRVSIRTHHMHMPLHAWSPCLPTVYVRPCGAPWYATFRSAPQVTQWLCRAATLVKSLDKNHMVTTGEEGYRTNGPYLKLEHNWWGQGGRCWGRLVVGALVGMAGMP